MPRNGFAGAATWMRAVCRRSITPFQLEASANAPWTRTTVRGPLDGCSDMRAPSLVGIDFDDGTSKRFWCFLWKVVADAAPDRAVRISARELAGIGIRELAAVPVVAGPAAFGGEVKLVPPLKLGLRRQRELADRLTPDQVAAHGNERLAALRPQRRHDVGRPRAPVEACDDRVIDLERVHQGYGIEGEGRRLP